MTAPTQTVTPDSSTSGASSPPAALDPGRSRGRFPSTAFSSTRHRSPISVPAWTTAPTPMLVSGPISPADAITAPISITAPDPIDAPEPITAPNWITAPDPIAAPAPIRTQAPLPAPSATDTSPASCAPAATLASGHASATAAPDIPQPSCSGRDPPGHHAARGAI